jgi:hypothetical protein
MQTLEVVYFALFASGASFAGVGWLVSHGGGHGSGQAASALVRGAHAHGIAAALNLGVVSGAACSGGAAGLVALSLGASSVGSVVAASLLALAGGAVLAKFFAFLANASTFQEATSPKIATSLTEFAGARVGEVVWICNNGVRRPLPARSDDGSKIERGTEVVVLAVERGIARVVPCSRVFGEEHRQ